MTPPPAHAPSARQAALSALAAAQRLAAQPLPAPGLCTLVDSLRAQAAMIRAR